MHMVASSNGKMQRVLQISMALTAAYVVATFFFGLRAHSLALISEAGHNVSDLLAILLSFVAVYFLVFGTGIYYMLKLMRSGPALPGQTPHGVPQHSPNETARRPMSAADQLIDVA